MRYLYHAMRMQLKCAAQYRASFLMQSIAQAVMVGGDLLAVTVLMNRFRGLGQWSAEEILFFFGVMQLTFALCECLGRGISNFSYYIGGGEFDAMLLRPQPLLLQMIGNRLDARRLGGLLVGGAALAMACLRLRLRWTAGKALLLGFFPGLRLFLLGKALLPEALIHAVLPLLTEADHRLEQQLVQQKHQHEKAQDSQQQFR